MARERIDPTPGHPGDARYVRRDERGELTDDQTRAGRSDAQDKRIGAEHEAPK
ncbi:MAG TPA: hypothetical protein VKR80_06860 [Candidatus Limnocylindria bacterium]|nr:hypothetical protein [Candidatus Limnocylindria bacterium]